MKRLLLFFITFILTLAILCSCGRTFIDENGVEHKMITNWVIIENMSSDQYIVYNPTTKIVYFLQYDSYNGYLSPYQMQTEDGFICGAIYENGQIKPAPYFTID